jgi:23S rRNA (pseudouridine1915-N3)-methyltransferase
MEILLIAAGKRQPAWVEDGYRDYARRLGRGWSLGLKEIPLGRRGRSSTPLRAREEEGRRMLAALPGSAHVVALVVGGEPWSTEDLSLRLEGWASLGAPVCLLIGGPDGLAESCLGRAQERWSLSPLTLPHGLARVVVAEALYRAWSLMTRHPYHRG